MINMDELLKLTRHKADKLDIDVGCAYLRIDTAPRNFQLFDCFLDLMVNKINWE